MPCGVGAATMIEPCTMEQKVTDIIKLIGIPAHLKGYYYGREAVLLVIEKDELMGAITSKSYPLIAEKHGTTPGRVERAIRTCLGAACSRGNTPFINRLFGPGKAEHGITNKEFIGRIADVLKNGEVDVAMYEKYPTAVIDEP